MLVKSCSLFNNPMFYIRRFDELDSTNDYAKANGADLMDKDVIWAKHQRKGRGRFDRTWESGEDLTFSILFQKTSISHAILAPLALVYALSSLQVETRIKWPNDILYQNKKCAGILIERMYEGNHHRFDVVGIGVNIANSMKAELVDKAINLPNQQDAEDVLFRILRMYTILLRMDKDSVMREYRRYSMLLGKEIEISGKRMLVSDISELGELIVSDGTEEVYLRSEEISLEQIYKDR